MSEHSIAVDCKRLVATIDAEKDMRTRMRHCRQALGLGRQAVLEVGRLSDEDIATVQSTLRFAQRVSKGFCNPNVFITRLAEIRMRRLGLEKLPLVSMTKPKRVITESACLAIADAELPENWADGAVCLEAANAGRYVVAGTGADGCYSVIIRLLDADEPFLEPPEYKRVVEALPPFALNVSTGFVLFGAAEVLGKGAVLAAANGRYGCQLVSLRSGSALRIIATLISCGDVAEPFQQLPEFHEI